jgi:hypothetical protein
VEIHVSVGGQIPFVPGSIGVNCPIWALIRFAREGVVALQAERFGIMIGIDIKGVCAGSDGRMSSRA